MSEMKIGSRVRVIDESSCFDGLVGRIAREYDGGYDWVVLFNNGQNDYFREISLKLVEPSFQTLLVGDIIINEIEGEAKVLEVGVNTFVMSQWDNFDIAGSSHTFKEAEIYYWTVKGQTEEKMITLPNGKEVSEATVMEALKQLSED